MLWDGSCSESGQTNFLAWCCLLVLVLLLLVLCVPVQYRVFSPPAAIIAARCSSMLAIGRCRRFSVISAHLSSRAWQRLLRFCGELSIHCTAQFIPNIFYGVPVWWYCMLLHLGDVSLLKQIKDDLSTVRCGIIVLVAVVITGMLYGKWH